jgi:phosphatidylglycerophosphate synthase
MESIKELRKMCQDKGYREHPTLRFCRIFSIYITKTFLILGLKRPEVVVVLGFLAGTTGGCFYLMNQFVLGSFFFFIFIVLDHVDGEIARYRKLVTSFGGWLDATSGHLLYPYFFLTLGLGIFFQTGIVWYIVLGSIAAIAKLVERSISHFVNIEGDQNLSRAQDKTSIKSWFSHIGKGTVLYIIVLLCSIAGWEKYFLWFFSIYLTILAFGKVVLTGRRIYSVEKKKKINF